MKKINLIKRLWTDGHEKQSPQRFARYAAMLIMLLTLGVGQMWAGTKRVYCQVTNSDWQAAGAKVNVHYWGDGISGTTWPGAKMAASGTANVYYADIPDNATFCFCRTNPNQDTDWGHKTGNLSFPASPASGLNLYEITGSGTSSTGQWANIGFESTGGNSIKYYYSGNASEQTWDISSASGASATKDLGTITSLYLKGWNMKMYQNMDAAIVNGTTNRWLYYNIHRSAVSPGDYSSKTLDSWTWPGWDGGYRKPYGSKSCNENLLEGLGSGIYSMTFYLQHNGLINFYLNNGGSNYNLNWTIGVPSVSGGAVTSNGTGTGAEGSPFSVADGNTITFTASGSQASTDANSVLYVKWGDDAYSSTTTKTITPTTTKQSMTVKLKYYNSADGLSGAETTLTIYYQSTLTPSIGISSISPSPANSGDEVTITASRQNAGEANITYQYSLNGESGWTTIGSATSSTTKTWTVPAITTTTTYYFRAQMTYSATTYTSDVVSLKAYGKKTIKVKNTNGWYPFYMHRWGGDRADTSFPGDDDQISDYGSGQWKQVVLYSSNNNFIFVDGTNNGNKNSDQTYAGVTDGACYEIASGTGVVALNSTVNCPAKPSVSASAATALTNTTATINGNISSNGNDAIKDYGFYWGTSSTPGTKVSKGTDDKSGAISHNLTGLTAGSTYYYQAYATNGQGETKSTPIQSFVVPYSVTISTATGCSAITPGTGTKYIKVGDVITATAADGYEFSSWSLSSVTLSSPTTTDGVTSSTVTAASNGGTIQPVYTTKTYTGVTLDKNTGSSDGAYSVTYLDNKITVTTTPAKTGYHVDGYYAEVGTTTHIATAAGALQSGKSGYTDGSGRWNQAGGKKLYTKWEANTYTATNNIDGNSGSNGQYTATYDATSIAINTAPTRTGYNLTGFHAYGRGANSLANSSGTLTASQSENGNGNRALTDASQHWIYDNTDAVIFADWSPKTYDITLDQEGGASGSTSVTMTYDASTHTAITNPSKTGYTFGGYWTGDNGTGTMVIATDGTLQANVSTYTGDGGIWKKDATCTLYAKWTANTYTITLTQEGETGYGSAGANSSVTATYDAALPDMGSAPTGAPGYKFQGYYTDHNGGGTQYYDADGTKKVASYTTAGTTTLYAYFLKSEITGLEHDASIAKGEEVTINVNPVINVTPEGYTAICWSLLYADTDNPVEGSHWSVAAHEEEGKPMQVTYTLKNLENGSYKIKAVYKSNGSSGFDACSTGTTQNTYYSTFRIIGSNTITVKYMTTSLLSDYQLQASNTVEIPAMDSIEVTAPEITGYTFTRWSLSDGISYAGNPKTTLTSNPVKIKATYDGTLIARYTKKKMVYFNNTVGWDTVFVYFYNGANGKKYWDNSVGTGANKQQQFVGEKPFWQKNYGGMKRVAPGSNIWYFDYLAAGFSEGDISANIAFAAKDQAIDKSGASDAEAFFYETKAIFRDDFDPTHLPMYVPLTSPTTLRNGDKTTYYDRGYWMNYPDSTGYELRIYNQKATDGAYELSYKRQLFKFTGDKTMPMSVTVDFEANRTYGFKIYRTDGTYWGNNGTMTNGHSGDEGQPVWEFTQGASSNGSLTTTGAGYYTFTLSYGEDLSKNFNYLVGVRYPESSGDFRVMYKDTAKNHTNWRPSAIIPLATDTTIVSYFVRKNKAPYIKAQKCTLVYNDPENPSDEDMTLTWADENGGANIIQMDTINKYGDGVYNFIFTKNNGALVLSKVEPYTGNFYIRVDGAGYSNWDRYIADDHLMPYSDYSFNQTTDPYSHYFTHYYNAPDDEHADRPNVKFVVANEYSPYISDTIAQDGVADRYVNENGYICRDANIRFMYNYKTNEATRRYIDGAQGPGSDNFLLLIPSNTTSIYDAQTDGNAYEQVKFSDNGNWIYEANVWVVPNTQFKLKCNYGVTSTSAFNENGIIESYLKGKESGDDQYETLIGGDDDTREHIRLLYDFKTNRLVSAWLPSGTINSDHAINADVMFIREGQEDVTQLTFGNSGSISAIQNVYSVMRFNKWTLNNRDKSSHSPLGSPLSPYERALYWISFPYDVRLSDVFGFGTYGKHWIIEYYDGAYRAEHGFWADSEANWKFVTPEMRNSFTLKAGIGYILALDPDEVGEDADIWKNTDVVELIFPGDIASISNTSVTYNIPAHNCNITRNSRNIKDSHWNVIGVPTYLNTQAVTFDATEEKQEWMSNGKPKYIYSWNPQDNSITAVSAIDFTYHSMTAYLVQYYGNITFTTSTVSVPAAARRYENAPRDVEFRLALLNGEQEDDNTFVRMSIDEDVTTGFEFGQDMTKEMNASKSNIYTLIAGGESNIEAAANVLPFNEQTTVVPVGVKIKNTGDYTFAIPQGTSGVGITLVDTETGIRTSLSALEYTVNLEAGTYDNRFYLVISPIVQNPTGIEDVTGDESQVTGARKVIIDQKMYIIKDGKMFDAQGRQVK